MLHAPRLVYTQKAVAPAASKLLTTSSRLCQVDPIQRTPKKDPPTRDEKVKKEYKLDAKDTKTKKEEKKFAEEMKKKGSMDEQD